MADRGFSPRIPLSYDSVDGPYRGIKTYRELIRQNFKGLLLTLPGERVMLPNYGVGLAKYIFENDVAKVQVELEQVITRQTSRWMPFINFENIVFDSKLEDRGIIYTDGNYLSINITYYVPVLSSLEVLNITADIDRKVFI